MGTDDLLKREENKESKESESLKLRKQTLF